MIIFLLYQIANTINTKVVLDDHTAKYPMCMGWTFSWNFTKESSSEINNKNYWYSRLA